MERRNFIHMLVAGGVLSAAPLTASASGHRLTAKTAQTVTVMSQSGLAQASNLLAQLDQVLGAAGVATQQVQVSEATLLDFAHVSDLLAQQAGRPLIGVMDDARALLFLEIATARGLACLRSTHHRYSPQLARHCCTADSLGLASAATTPAHTPAQQIGHLYAHTVQTPADPHPLARRPSASLVSFLIQA